MQVTKNKCEQIEEGEFNSILHMLNILMDSVTKVGTEGRLSKLVACVIVASLCQENLIRQEICNLLESEVTRPALERTFVLRTKSRSSGDQCVVISA